MSKKWIYIVVVVFLVGCKSQEIVTTPTTNFPVENALTAEDSIGQKIQFIINYHKDHQSDTLYQSQHYLPVWYHSNLYTKAIQWLKDAKYHDLNPSDYQITTLDSLLQAIKSSKTPDYTLYAELDILLTKSVNQCGRDIRYSSLNPISFHDSWNYSKPNNLYYNWISLVKKNGIAALDSYFEPNHTLYPKLKNELKRLMNQPEYPLPKNLVYPGFNLQKGDSNQYVLPVKRKLLNIPPDSVIDMKFNEELKQAVIKLQKRHGLYADGVVGKRTYEFLSWDKSRYIKSIVLNMNRLRWMPDGQLNQGITVNIPSQTLCFYYNNQCMFSGRVVVGKFETQTPVFYSDITFLVFNPCWTVPKSIANKSMLYGAQKDSAYFEKRNMFLTQTGVEIPTDSIDFKLYNSESFPFTVMQRSDDGNALGKVKFMFNNQHSIYLHDTPQKSLFNREIRNFSHGCVRVQNALDLADQVLKHAKNSHKSIDSYLSKGFPVRVNLNRKIPVNLVYFTCWENPETGELTFYKDIYAKDYRMEIVKK